MICKQSLSLALMAIAAALPALTTKSAGAADHTDSPAVRADGTLDINDLYAFQSPQNPANVVLIMTVNPFAGQLANSSTAFNTRGIYEFVIDTDGNATPNVVYRFYFSAVRNGSQRYIVTQQNGRVVTSGVTGQTTRIRTGGMVTCGLFDDPFFFDSAGFNNGLAFTGTNFFANANVSCIVLEVPRSTFGADNIGVYCRTVGAGRQFDRVGRPAINTVLISGPRKDVFNRADTVRDVANFNTDVVNTLLALGNTPAQANTLAGILLPDVLTINTSDASGFLNGRRLADDVIDAELALLTNGAVTTDLVDANDRPFLNVFPYLAPAQTLAP